MDITEMEYRNNLLFYTILKDLLKCRLGEKRLMILEETIEQNTNLPCNKMKQLLSNGIVAENTKAYDELMILLNLANNNNYNMWKDLLLVSIELLLTKDLILEESKSYARVKYKEKIDKIKDKLGLEYDFTFYIDDRKYGVSAKRTLKERYKQNFEDVDFLTVDAMFLITLGIDLNEDKLNNIPAQGKLSFWKFDY